MKTSTCVMFAVVAVLLALFVTAKEEFSGRLGSSYTLMGHEAYSIPPQISAYHQKWRYELSPPSFSVRQSAGWLDLHNVMPTGYLSHKALSCRPSHYFNARSGECEPRLQN